MSIEKVIEGLKEEIQSIDGDINAKLWEVRKLLKSKLSLAESMLIFLDKVMQGSRTGELSEEKIKNILWLLEGDNMARNLPKVSLPLSADNPTGNGVLTPEENSDFEVKAAKMGLVRSKDMSIHPMLEHVEERINKTIEGTEFEGIQVKFKKRSLAETAGKSKGSKKFNTYLREVIEKFPEKKFEVSELAGLMTEAVRNKLVKAPAKSVKYAIQTAVWYLKKSGMVNEEEKGSYQWSKDWIEKRPGKKAEVDEPENLSLLDEAVINVLVSYKKTAISEFITGEVRKCLNFLEISKSLSSNLDVAVGESLEKLTRLKLIIENSEGWRIK